MQDVSTRRSLSTVYRILYAVDKTFGLQFSLSESVTCGIIDAAMRSLVSLTLQNCAYNALANSVEIQDHAI